MHASVTGRPPRSNAVCHSARCWRDLTEVTDSDPTADCELESDLIRRHQRQSEALTSAINPHRLRLLS